MISQKSRVPEWGKVKIQNYNSKFKIKYIYLFLIIFFQFFVIVNYAHALGPLISGLAQECKDCGNCELDDFVKIAYWIWSWILSISGSLALLFFIYGGFTFLISGGSSERVTKGKTILINSVIGLVIIFCSFMLVNFILLKVEYKKDPKDGQWHETKPVVHRSCPDAKQCPAGTAWDSANNRCSTLLY